MRSVPSASLALSFRTRMNCRVFRELCSRLGVLALDRRICRRDMEILMKTAFAAFAFLLAVSAAACNTVEGVGEDVTAAGTAVDRAAEDAQH